MENKKSAETILTEVDSRFVRKGVFVEPLWKVACLICGEGVPVAHYTQGPRICEKCKAAVMKVREQDGK